MLSTFQRLYFKGNITEKSDATNEFITYAVSPVAEVINDTLTAYVVGEDDYCSKNEKVMVWLARFKHVDVVDSAVNLDKLRGIGSISTKSEGWSDIRYSIQNSVQSEL